MNSIIPPLCMNWFINIHFSYTISDSKSKFYIFILNSQNIETFKWMQQQQTLKVLILASNKKLINLSTFFTQKWSIKYENKSVGNIYSCLIYGLCILWWSIKIDIIHFKEFMLENIIWKTIWMFIYCM